MHYLAKHNEQRLTLLTLWDRCRTTLVGNLLEVDGAKCSTKWWFQIMEAVVSCRLSFFQRGRLYTLQSHDSVHPN